MGIIDGIIVLLLLIFIIIGFVKGFLKQVLSTLAWVIALIAASLFSSSLSGVLVNTTIGINVNDYIYNWISSKGDIFTMSIPELTDEYLSTVLSDVGIPNVLHGVLKGMIDVSEFSNTSIVEFITPEITSMLGNIVSFILIYLIVFIIIKIIALICKKIVRGSALGVLDGLLGAAWGVVKIGIIISILMLGLSFVVTMPFGESVNEWITADMKLNEDGFGIAKFFYENNPILLIISALPFNK